jgi:hypothetical protein
VARWRLKQQTDARFKRDREGYHGEQAGGFMYGYADGYLRLPMGNNPRAFREWVAEYTDGYLAGFADGA